MNDASSPAPGASLLPDGISLITSVHFILIALFAVAVVAMIVVGIARKRRRKQADAAFAERVEQAETADEKWPETNEPVAIPMPPDVDIDASTPAIALTQLKGLGPKVAAQMEAIGIRSVTQLAGLTDADAARVDGALGPFAGRLTRDRWVEQARLLTSGDRAGFEAKFGKL